MGKLQQLIEINGQQQQQQQQQPQQQANNNTQQQYLSTCSTMPAMPKEKATAVSLNESNFTELKLKELATSAAVVTAMAATTATASTQAGSRLQAPGTPQHNHSHHHQHHNTNSFGPSHNHHHSHPQQQQREQYQLPARSTCGCGAASATAGIDVVDSSSSSTSSSMYRNSSSYYPNGHSSPLAAAVAAQNASSNVSLASTGSSSPHRISSICCRQPYQNQNGQIYRTNDAAAATSANNALDATAPTVAAVTPPKKSPKDFIFPKYIGEGSFSTVYLGIDVNTKREYAIKVCEKRHILKEDKQEYIRREREVMHMMTNVPGFVNLSCTFQDQGSLYFVMTLAKNGDLLPYINKVGSFDFDCTRHYAAELVLACEQMHRRHVVHRDLKPENILLDEDMHTMIADFGSAKILTPADYESAAVGSAAAASSSSSASASANHYSGSRHSNTTTPASACTRQSRSQSRNYTDDDDDDQDHDDNDNDNDNAATTTDDTGSDDVDSPNRQRRYHRKRKGSFVGTAQYVSPEVLQNGPITASADLWALGCIIYQMISGLPPFRGSNDYVIFKEILACNVDFPEGFDQDAEDLVRKLLKINPAERLGAHDERGQYESIRSHPFFAGVDFDTIREQTPPPIYPYLPGVPKDDIFPAHYRVPEDLEPGLNDKQKTRLLWREFGPMPDWTDNERIVDKEKKTVKNNFDLSDAEKQRRLEQQSAEKWHVFADNEVILKKGFVNKRKGLFARKRMLLLTTGPRLIYIDPVQMIKKGEIPWTPELRVEPKDFKIFFVHTPNRTYYLEDPEGYSLEWVSAIEKMHALSYQKPKQKPDTPTNGGVAVGATSNSGGSLSACTDALTLKKTASN